MAANWSICTSSDAYERKKAATNNMAANILTPPKDTYGNHLKGQGIASGDFACPKAYPSYVLIPQPQMRVFNKTARLLINNRTYTRKALRFRCPLLGNPGNGGDDLFDTNLHR